MLRTAALVPGTALLVPGVAGRADVLETLRGAALRAVTDVLAAEPERLVVVAHGRRSARSHGPVRPTLAGAGVDDERLGWAVRASPSDVDPGRAQAVTDVAAAVGLLVVQRSGWSGPVEVVTLGDAKRAQVRGLGRELAGEDLGLVVVGSLSARHGPDAPLPDDPAALAYDRAALACLADGTEGLVRLTDGTREEAERLAVTAWAPLQLLRGAAASRLRAEVSPGVAHGACHAVVSWSST